mgnify:CR=1 FL=1
MVVVVVVSSGSGGSGGGGGYSSSSSSGSGCGSSSDGAVVMGVLYCARSQTENTGCHHAARAFAEQP